MQDFHFYLFGKNSILQLCFRCSISPRCPIEFEGFCEHYIVTAAHECSKCLLERCWNVKIWKRKRIYSWFLISIIKNIISGVLFRLNIWHNGRWQLLLDQFRLRRRAHGGRGRCLEQELCVLVT